MSVNVRIYSAEGIVALPISSYAGRLATNGEFALKMPYLGGEVIAANTGAAVASTPATSSPSTNNNIKCLLVQLAPGGRVHYEVTPFGHDPRTAAITSPIIQSETILPWGPGWALSVLEAAVDA